MKENVITPLNAVLNSLNSINVSGKNNLANLYASIQILEQVVGFVSSGALEEQKEENDKEKEV